MVEKLSYTRLRQPVRHFTFIAHFFGLYRNTHTTSCLSRSEEESCSVPCVCVFFKVLPSIHPRKITVILVPSAWNYVRIYCCAGNTNNRNSTSSLRCGGGGDKNNNSNSDSVNNLNIDLRAIRERINMTQHGPSDRKTIP